MHRTLGASKAYSKNKNLNVRFNGNILNYSAKQAQEYQSQQAKQNPIPKSRIEELESSRYADIVVKQLRDILVKADSQLEYISPEGLRNSEFNESSYIFKKIKKGKQRADEVLDCNFINRKMLLIKKVFDNDYLKAEDIIRSGMMYMANNIFENKGMFVRKDIDSIAQQFGVPEISLSNGAMGFNITNLKRKIFHSSMNKMYPEFQYTE